MRRPPLFSVRDFMLGADSIGVCRSVRSPLL